METREWETQQLPAPKRREKVAEETWQVALNAGQGMEGEGGGGGGVRAEKWWKIVSNESVEKQKHSGGTVRSKGSQYSRHPSADRLPAV